MGKDQKKKKRLNGGSEPKEETAQHRLNRELLYVLQIFAMMEHGRISKSSENLRDCHLEKENQSAGITLFSLLLLSEGQIGNSCR